MENQNVFIQEDLYRMILNLPHRRLIVDDGFRLFQTPPQKKVYPSVGCLLLRCPFRFLTCDKCNQSYNILEL